MTRDELFNRLKCEPIINTHSHHLPDEYHQKLNLENVLRNSYVNWCGKPIPSSCSKSEITLFLNTVRSRSFFVWLEKALMELYGIDEHLSADTWDVYSLAIQKAHEDGNRHIKILRDKCNYKSIFLDTYWNPGDDNNHPEIFKPVYRVDSIFYGYNRTAKDHDGNNFQVLQNQAITDICEYTGLIEKVLREKKQAGYTVLKCAIAYDRSLHFEPATKEKARKAMRENPDAEDIKAFQDYVFDRILKIAAELSMAVQIHTGLGLMIDSNAMHLKPIIERNPETTFWLMHGSYPWSGDIAGLTYTYPNVWADLCWLPLLSPTAAQRLLHELIDVCNADRIVWGCDTWTSEESYGARLAFLNVLSRVLSERMEAGLMHEFDAIQYARMIMHENASKYLNVDRTWTIPIH